jgi:hypothetical protein
MESEVVMTASRLLLLRLLGITRVAWWHIQRYTLCARSGYKNRPHATLPNLGLARLAPAEDGAAASACGRRRSAL